MYRLKCSSTVVQRGFGEGVGKVGWADTADIVRCREPEFKTKDSETANNNSGTGGPKSKRWGREKFTSRRARGNPRRAFADNGVVAARLVGERFACAPGTRSGPGTRHWPGVHGIGGVTFCRFSRTAIEIPSPTFTAFDISEPNASARGHRARTVIAHRPGEYGRRPNHARAVFFISALVTFANTRVPPSSALHTARAHAYACKRHTVKSRAFSLTNRVPAKRMEIERKHSPAGRATASTGDFPSESAAGQ